MSAPASTRSEGALRQSGGDVARRVTIVIPTVCSPERASGLVRAIESLHAQTVGIPSILVVANGPRVSRDLVQSVQELYRVDVCSLQEGNLPRAIRAGRAAVQTPYFGFLDDDDEYLPDALAVRVDALERHPEAALAVTDGLYVEDGREEPRGVATDEAGRDPLRALTRRNWLASCGGLFRSELVPEALFDGVTQYFEWTYIAYKVAASHRVVVMPVPGYRIHSERGSLSKSEAYRLAEPAALSAIARLDLPEDVRRNVLARRGAAFHSLSSHYLRAGERGQAWRTHLSSLKDPGGSRYITYTARLIVGARRGAHDVEP